MIAFDADILTEIWAGHSAYAERAAQFPLHEQAVPVVVVEEILRGRLNAIRQAEAGKLKLSIERAYGLLEETVHAFRQVLILPYTRQAETQFQQWRTQKIRVGTHDLRIAASCLVHAAKLVTRNGRDFEQVPKLLFEIWT